MRFDASEVKPEKPHKIFEIVGLLLLEHGPRFGLMDRVISGQEYARGHGKEFPVIFQGVCILVIHLLGQGLIVKLLDAPVFKSIGHQSGVEGVQQLVKHDRILRIRAHTFGRTGSNVT